MSNKFLVFLVENVEKSNIVMRFCHGTSRYIHGESSVNKPFGLLNGGLPLVLIHFRLAFPVENHPGMGVPPWLWKPPFSVAFHRSPRGPVPRSSRCVCSATAWATRGEAMDSFTLGGAVQHGAPAMKSRGVVYVVCWCMLWFLMPITSLNILSHLATIVSWLGFKWEYNGDITIIQ